jgi:hypothetical protein
MKKLLTLAILAVIVWLTIISVRPYWDRHWLQKDMEEAAVYGTKKSEDELRNFLTEKMKENDRKLTGNDFFISKDERKTVYLKLAYADEIRFAGYTLKRLQFTLEAKERETRSSF